MLNKEQISKTSLQYIPIINNILDPYVESFQNKFFIKKESLPHFFQKSLNFTITVMLLCSIAVTCANNLISNIVGILYPVLYGFVALTKTTQVPMDNFNKYWMLYGIITLIDSFLGFILYLIPLYFYFKISLFILLIKNDFQYSGTVFEIIKLIYIESPLKQHNEMLVEEIENKIDTDENDFIEVK